MQSIEDDSDVSFLINLCASKLLVLHVVLLILVLAWILAQERNESTPKLWSMDTSQAFSQFMSVRVGIPVL